MPLPLRSLGGPGDGRSPAPLRHGLACLVWHPALVRGSVGIGPAVSLGVRVSLTVTTLSYCSAPSSVNEDPLVIFATLGFVETVIEQAPRSPSHRSQVDLRPGGACDGAPSELCPGGGGPEPAMGRGQPGPGTPPPPRDRHHLGRSCCSVIPVLSESLCRGTLV